MTPYIALKPFTEFDTQILGGLLHRIVKAPANRRLTTDFPAVRKNYGKFKSAVEAVHSRQKSMRSEPAYAALAVMIGTSRQDAQVYGATSMLVQVVPGTNNPGVNLALWLDANRIGAFRNIGHELLKMRIHWLIARKAFTGSIWTIIRPANRGAMRPWTQSGYPVELLRSREPKSYKDIDGVGKPRQLFVAAKPLEALR